MIKVRVGDGILFGIDEENVKRLKAGKPIKIALRELGFDNDIDIMIFYKPTMGDLIKTVQPFIGKDTKVDDRLD